MIDEDERLRAFFAELRRADERLAPAFRTLWTRAAVPAPAKAGACPIRVFVTAAAIALAVMALALRPRQPALFPPLPIAIGAALPLDGLLTMPDAPARSLPDFEFGAPFTWAAMNGGITWEGW
ncbi:MAG TPA: hypothetical protein VIV57_18265 [Anaeromyxobacter sp.]